MRKIHEKKARELYGGFPVIQLIEASQKIVKKITGSTPAPTVQVTGHSQSNLKNQGKLNR